MVDRILPVAGIEDLIAFKHLFTSSARKKMANDHLWLSVFSRPTRSNFTRVQRLSCCMSLLFLTMITNAMFFKSEDQQSTTTGIRLGPIQFTLGQVHVALVVIVVVGGDGVVVVVVVFLVVVVMVFVVAVVVVGGDGIVVVVVGDGVFIVFVVVVVVVVVGGVVVIVAVDDGDGFDIVAECGGGVIGGGFFSSSSFLLFFACFLCLEN